MSRNILYEEPDILDSDHEIDELEAIDELDKYEIGIEEEPEAIIGEVFDCAKLNVREEPRSDAKVACVIDVGTEVMINEADSTDEFYKICLVSGIEGYCMKKFIAVK